MNRTERYDFMTAEDTQLRCLNIDSLATIGKEHGILLHT